MNHTRRLLMSLLIAFLLIGPTPVIAQADDLPVDPDMEDRLVLFEGFYRPG